MKILFFADTHLGFDFPIHPRIERRRRGTDFFANYHTILDHAKRESVDLLIHGGDMFFRSKLPRRIVELGYEPLLSVLDQGIDMVIVPGNHERSKLPDSPLLKHQRLHVLDRPRTFLFNKAGQSLAVGGFPNVRHNIRGSFTSVLQQSKLLEASADIKLLVLHQAIEDAVVGAHNYRFKRDPDVIGLNQYPDGLDLILSGHLHRAQVLASQQGTPILYPGSIERTSFAEREETKGYIAISTAEKGLSWEFIPLPARPMLEIELAEELSTKPALFQRLEREIPHLPSNAIIRVKCTNQIQVGLLSTSELRRIFPDTMNVDLAFPRDGLQNNTPGKADVP